MTDNLYTYQATISNIIDGDTYDAIVDLGFNMTFKIRIRLMDIDTNETWHVDKTTTLYANGVAAKNRASELLLHKVVTIKTYKDSTVYGRYSAKIILSDGKSLADILISEGYNKVK